MIQALDPFLSSRSDGPATSLAQLRKAVLDGPRPANIVLVTGAAVGLQFPPVCPNCAGPAHRPVRIERASKLYIYDSEAPTRTIYAIEHFAVPFCESCAQQDGAARSTPSPWLPLKRLFAGSGEALGAAVIILIGFMFVPDAIRRLSIVPLLFAAVPWSVGAFLLHRNWVRNRFLAVPPDTPVTLALEFTPVLSRDYEPAWRAFRFRNLAYAEHFRSLNAQQLWDPGGTEARRAREKRRNRRSLKNWIIGVIVVAILLWGLWDDYGDTVLEFLGR